MNYKETTITGSVWTRCRAVTITNPRAGMVGYDDKPDVPTAHFQEERIVSLEGADMRSDCG